MNCDKNKTLHYTQGWGDDPFASPQQQNNNQGQAQQKSDDLFGDSLFGGGGGAAPNNNNNNNNNNQANNNTTDLFGFGGQPQAQPQQQPQANNMGFGNMMGGGQPQAQQGGFGGMGMNQGMNQGGMMGGMMGQAQPQAQPQAPQNSGFLAALGSYNAVEEAKKKAEEEAKRKAEEEAAAKAQANANNQGQKQEQGDPFADLMGSIDLAPNNAQNNYNAPNRMSQNNSMQGTPVQGAVNPQLAAMPAMGGLGGQQSQGNVSVIFFGVTCICPSLYLDL